jgi:uncharacterized lipoprotein YmbA
MNPLKTAALLACMAAGLLLTGCSGLAQPYHEKELYALTLASGPATQPDSMQPVPSQPAAPGVCVGMNNPMRVRPVRVASPYTNTELVYKTKTGTYTTDYYRAFVASPDKLLTTGLVEYLSSHGNAYTIAPGSIADGSYDLESQCTLLLGDYSGPSPVARVAFRFQLVKTQGPLIRPIWSKAYAKDIPFEDKGAQPLIDALSQGVREVFADLSADLDKTGEFPK